MSKFTNSKESVSSNLILWHGRQTQVGIRETYDMKVWPITNVYNDGPVVKPTMGLAMCRNKSY